MDMPRRAGGTEEGYRYEAPLIFEPGQVTQRRFEECYEERLRRPGESLRDWLDAIHMAMLEAPSGPRRHILRREVEQTNAGVSDDDRDLIDGEEPSLEHLGDEDDTE